MIAKGVLPDFQEFLLSHKLAPEKHVLFLAIWVSRFLAFSNRKGQQDIGLTVTEFLNSLEAREDIKDWQIRQAGEAVRLYLNHFKGGEELKTLSGKERLIRLKHFAYNTELARLRVLDIDFGGNLLVVRTGKGDKDRSTILSEAVKEPLRLHLEKVKALHDKDLSAGHAPHSGAGKPDNDKTSLYGQTLNRIKCSINHNCSIGYPLLLSISTIPLFPTRCPAPTMTK